MPSQPKFKKSVFECEMYVYQNGNYIASFGANWIDPKTGKNYYDRYGVKGHLGLDLKPYDKNLTRIYCPYSSKIIFMGDNKSRGNRVVVWIKELNICMTFNHLEFFNPSLSVGDEIAEKEFIGVMGNTGTGTGAHLHLEVMPVDDKANLLYPLNGYLGCVDPLPYL